MKLTTKTLRQLTITDAPSPPNRGKLDPIRVLIENTGPGAGMLTVICFGRAWSAYWGAMSGRTVEQFVADCEPDYVADNLIRGTVYHDEEELRDADIAYLTRIVEAVQLALDADEQTNIEEKVLRAADGVIAMASAAALTLTVEQVPNGTPRMGGYDTVVSVRLTNAERRRVEELARLKEAV